MVAKIVHELVCLIEERSGTEECRSGIKKRTSVKSVDIH